MGSLSVAGIIGRLHHGSPRRSFDPYFPKPESQGSEDGVIGVEVLEICGRRQKFVEKL